MPVMEFRCTFCFATHRVEVSPTGVIEDMKFICVGPPEKRHMESQTVRLPLVIDGKEV